jgi:hypothetical protein
MKSTLHLAAIGSFFGLFLFSQCYGADDKPINEHSGIRKVAFSSLEKILDKKKVQVQKYCNGIHALAKSVKQDEQMQKFFDLKLKYYNLSKSSKAPTRAIKLIGQYKTKITEHYIRRYRPFYDILFIARNGDIFFTMRKEADYHSNIFAGKLAKTKLSRQLSKAPSECFVDFQYFFPSDEPAAFFVKPAYKGKEQIGWFAFQWAVNKLNSLCTDHEELGLTGEVFLVNKAQYTLTDSRFFSDSTIMKRHLSQDNVLAKFRQKKGYKIVVDYRGFRVLTTFEVVPFLGSEYLIIVKRDEDEIITEHYKTHRKYYCKRMVDYLASRSAKAGERLKQGPKVAKVDMDEFVKVRKGQYLQTPGVSTCTAIIGAYPRRFAYMAHVTPFDKLYNQSTTDLLGQIVRRIKVYDIHKYERRNVQFFIVANHTETFSNYVNKLLDEDFLLSQMTFLYDPKASVANVSYDYNGNNICTEWTIRRDRSVKKLQNAEKEDNLGIIMRQFLSQVKYPR